MSVQLVRLRGVPEDEAREIRELLEAHAIEYFETPAGNWGLSMPALWLEDAAELPRARSLLDAYQRERALRVRREYEALKRAGKARTLLDALREEPLRIALYLAAIAAVVYLSTVPFLGMGRGD
jgi:hypothetical protein